MDMNTTLKAIGFRVASALALKPGTWTRRRILQTLEGVLVFFASVLAVGSWWKWAKGDVHLYMPILWSVATLVVLVIAKDRKRVVYMGLGGWVLYSLKAIFLDGEPRAIFIVVIAFILGLIIEKFAPSESR